MGSLKKMTTGVKRGSFLKTVQLIAVVIMIIFTDCGIVSSKPAMNSKVDTADRQTGINRYQEINCNGEQLKSITPPTNISNHQIIPFQNDQSCASAALATVLKYSFNVDVNEKNVINGLMTYGDKDSIEKKDAFSFYDMKCFLDAIGYTGIGYTIDGLISFKQFNDDDFNHIRNRAIIPIVIDGYAHLSVYRSYDSQFVYLGSPLYGNICMTYDAFRKVIFKNSIFIIQSKN